MQRVLVDANVLFSRTLRDWLFMLSLELDGMFSICTTEDIIAETVYRTRRSKPDAPGGLTAKLGNDLRKNCNEIIAEFDCSSPYDGSDPNDAHVHAAAKDGACDILLTADQGFEKLAARQDLEYSVYSADAFFVLIDDSAARETLAVVEAQFDYWRGRNGEAKLVESLRAAGCPEFARRVDAHLLTLAGVPPYSAERTRHLRRLAHRSES